MTALARAAAHVPSLLSPIHPFIPFPIIDLFGAMRLSEVVNWFATGAFDEPPLKADGIAEKVSLHKRPPKKRRASLLQECFGILVIVFGGETFLGMITGVTPSWLVSLKPALLFSVVHALQTRTSFVQYLPSRPTLGPELLLAVPDAIGRALLLTRFSVLSILHPPAGASILPPTPTTLLLTPFLLAVPFPSLIFTGVNWFSPSPYLTTPLELRPGGWLMVDFWAPIIIPAFFLSLIGPVPGWTYGLGWAEDQAVVAVMLVLIGLFVSRTVYNLGSTREAWTGLFGASKKPLKLKTL